MQDASKPRHALHPTTRLLLWLLFLVAVQLLSGYALAVVILLMPLCGTAVLKRGWLLVRRARWLLLSLFVILAWGSAGEPLWDADLAPTQEGLNDALIHLGRLLLVLLAVAALLEKMSIPDLFAASHTLFGPLRRLGLDPDRGIVRLMLVLRYVEKLPRPRDWRSLLEVPVTTVSETIEVNCPPLRWYDYALPASAVLALVGFCLL
jgi:energy-coupling factor transporter transmembrane protein EcfT